MFLICGIPDVNMNMDEKANLKFLGCRIMIMVAAVQFQLINIVVTGDTSTKSEIERWVYQMHSWRFTEYEARLFHSSLLAVESLGIVIFNLMVWYMDEEKAARLSGFKLGDRKPSERSRCIKGFKGMFDKFFGKDGSEGD